MRRLGLIDLLVLGGLIVLLVLAARVEFERFESRSAPGRAAAGEAEP